MQYEIVIKIYHEVIDSRDSQSLACAFVDEKLRRALVQNWANLHKIQKRFSFLHFRLNGIRGELVFFNGHDANRPSLRELSVYVLQLARKSSVCVF